MNPAGTYMFTSGFLVSSSSANSTGSSFRNCTLLVGKKKNIALWTPNMIPNTIFASSTLSTLFFIIELENTTRICIGLPHCNHVQLIRMFNQNKVKGQNSFFLMLSDGDPTFIFSVHLFLTSSSEVRSSFYSANLFHTQESHGRHSPRTLHRRTEEIVLISQIIVWKRVGEPKEIWK